jgi:hypothetical protein
MDIMYKFFGEKNKEVKNGLGAIVLRFDTKGEFITDDESLIERMKSHFDYIELEEAKTIGTRVKVAIEVSKMIIGVPEVKENKLKCSKCDFATDNQGLLMSHYREHKKGEK